MFVKNPLIAKRLQIQFQTFQLDAHQVRRVGDRQGPKIRLARLGTNRRELGADDLDRIIPTWVLILKYLENRWVWQHHQLLLRMSPLLARCAFWQDNDTGNSGYTVRILCRETGERLENFSAVRIAEIYTSIQGEGFLTGTTSSFVRVTGCNLRCWFCDTPYTSWDPQGEHLEVPEVFQRVQALECRHVVITGGEPMLYQDLVLLCEQLRAVGHHITLETAGTRFLPLHCDLMSISPKMANSIPSLERAAEWRDRHEQRRRRPAVIRQLIDTYTTYQIKFWMQR